MESKSTLSSVLLREQAKPEEETSSYQKKQLSPREKKIMEERKKLISKLITSISNFSVQYNFQAIAVALLVMSATVCTTDDEECKDGKQAAWVHGTASATIFIGAILGQLTMGYLGDVIGRNQALFFTLCLASFGALASAILPMGDATTIYVVIIISRFVLGIGVGGVYPLSATKAAEDSSTGGGKPNAVESAKSFFWQSPGAMTPWFVAYCLTYSNSSAETKWRLILGLGALPALLVVCGSMYESHLDSLVTSRVVKAKENSIPLTESLSAPENIKKLIASGGGWFIYDVAYYGVNLFAGEILNAMDGDDDNVSADVNIREVCWKEIIAAGMGIPACLLTIWLMDSWGIKKLQVIGFILIAIGFGVMAACFVPLRDYPDYLFTIYCFLLFFLSFGPNATTFVLSSQIYPKAIRATFNGISAAMGKLGAAVGAYMFGPMAEVTSISTVMVICAVISFIGAIVSYFYIDIDEDDISEYKALGDEEEDEGIQKRQSEHQSI